MVDLPSVPRRPALTEAPRSLVSAGDIAQPFSELAKGLDKLGDALGDASVITAENAAQKAVTRDADGNLSVSLMPDFSGRAGRAYNRIAQQSYLAQLDPDVKNAVTQKQIEFEGKPEAFQGWMETYTETLAGKQSTDEMRNAVRSKLVQYGEQTHRGMILQKHKTDITRANEATNAQLLTYSDDIEALALGGAPQEVIAAKTKEFDDLLNEKVNNPLIAFPREKADRFKDEVLTRAYMGSTLNMVQSVYSKEGGGYQAARSALNDAVAALGGTVKDAAKIRRAGEGWLNAQEKEMKAERSQVDLEWKAAQKDFANQSPAVLDALEERARDVGAWKVSSDIAQRRATLELTTAVRQLPREDQLRMAVTGEVPKLPGLSPRAQAVLQDSFTALRDKGVEIKVSSGHRDAGHNHAVGGAKGSQHINGNAIDIPLKGMTEDQRRMVVDQVLSDPRVGGFGYYPNSQSIHFDVRQGGRAAWGTSYRNDSVGQGWPSWMTQSVRQWQGGSAPAAGGFTGTAQPSGVPAAPNAEWPETARAGARAEIAENRASIMAVNEVRASLQKDLADRIKSFDAADRKLQLPSLDEMEGLVEEVSALGTPQQKDKVKELLAQAIAGEELKSMSAPKRAEAISAAEAQMAAGAEKFDRKLVDGVKEADKTISKAYKDDPYAAHARFGGGQALPAINFSDPAQMQAVLGAKVKQQAVIRAGEDMGAFPVLRPAEAESFRNFTGTATAEQFAGALAALGTLDDEALFQTLGQEPVKEGLRAAMRSTDPAKYTAVMSAMDQIYQRGPEQTTKLIGDEGKHDLFTWQSNLRYMDPETLAKERQRALDPAEAEQRKRSMAAARESFKTKKPDDIIKGFDNSWGITPGFIADALGSRANVPMDERTLNTFMGDAETIYERRFAATRDPEQALKQTFEFMKDKWKRSDVNGGQIMLRAPESVYPAVNGKHEYVKTQLEAALTEQFGERQSMVQEFRRDPVGKSPSWDYRIITDRRTETEAQRYDKTKPISDTNRPPSYAVVVRNNKLTREEWTVVTKPGGGERRFAFDPTGPQATDAAEDAAARAAYDARFVRPLDKLPLGKTPFEIRSQRDNEGQ